VSDWTKDLPQTSVAEATRDLIAEVGDACGLSPSQARRALAYALGPEIGGERDYRNDQHAGGCRPGKGRVMLRQMQLFDVGLANLDMQPRRGWRKPRVRTTGQGRHTDSLAAHDAMRSRIRARQGLVLGWVDEHGPATDREIRDGLYGEGADMNLVRPRVSELLDAGMLAECGRCEDVVTGRTVRRVRAVGSERGLA